MNPVGKKFGPKTNQGQLLRRIPDSPDIVALMQQASAKQGRGASLSWSMPGSDHVYRLSVNYDGASEPMWELGEESQQGERTIWTYRSGDPTLLYSLIMSECKGGEPDPMMTAHLPTNPSKAPPSMSMSMPALPPPSLPPAPARPEGMSPTIGVARLQGELVDMPVPNLLQSVGLSNMTGVLVVQSNQGLGEVIFESGRPLHAVSPGLVGDRAIVEMCTWEEGGFHFVRESRQVEPTVRRDMQGLLLEGIALLDQLKFLRQGGYTGETRLALNPAVQNADQFLAAVRPHINVNEAALLTLHNHLLSRPTINDLGSTLGLGKNDLTPVVYNLVSNQIVVRYAQKEEANEQKPDLAIKIDRGAVQTVERYLVRPETGIYSNAAFLFFAEQEFYRYQSTNAPMSIIVLEMGMARDSGVVTLPTKAIVEALKRICLVKRKMDIMAHFETFDYALLLPLTPANTAAVIAQRAHEVLMKIALAPDVDFRNLRLAFGVASIPEDCQDLEMLLGLAKHAKNMAKGGTQIFLAGSLKAH
ncbi:MAG TPA: DUF4388 domain-containing protein [Candidatus Obscuribacterales bacterium]